MPMDITPSSPSLGLTRQETWRNEESIPKVIQRFMEDYSVEHYAGLAERADDLIKEGLKKAEVHANTQFRAKTKEGLQRKLCGRYSTKRYANSGEIRKDIADFAGVRIIMYVPNKDQLAKVRKVIQSVWGKVEPILHPQEENGGKATSTENCESCERCRKGGGDEADRYQHDGNGQATSDTESIAGEEEEYQPIHLGYKAYHYRCPMRKNHERRYAKRYFWREDDQVEIQVVSALVHAWAEVGHGVLYKGFTFGRATNQEQLLLDALKGLIQSGDLLLGQFYELVEERTVKRFTHSDDLRSCLRKMDILNTPEGRPECEDEALELLFQFVKIKEYDYPLALREIFGEFGLPRYNTMERFVEEEFRPPFQPASNMIVSICLIHRMTWKEDNMNEAQEYQLVKEFEPAERCCIMMRALVLLQTFFGSAEAVKPYLQNLAKDNAEERSLDFILTNCFLQELLDEQDLYLSENQKELKPNILGAWNWFMKQYNNPASICGLAFRLAEMGAAGNAEVDTLLERLTIGQLSRSITGSDESDEQYHGVEVQYPIR